jgi:hypothetical protein
MAARTEGNVSCATPSGHSKTMFCGYTRASLPLRMASSLTKASALLEGEQTFNSLSVSGQGIVVRRRA